MFIRSNDGRDQNYKIFFWENPSLPGPELYGYLVFKKRIFETVEVAKTASQEFPLCRPKRF